MIPENLQTTRLSMRPFTEGDGAAVYAYWRSDPDWERFNASVPSEFSEKDAGSFVAEMTNRDRSQHPSWALLHGGKVVGVVSLSFEKGHRAATIGYGIHADLRGRGLCAEAAKKVLNSAFLSHSELEEVRAHTDAGNSASIRVLRKLGFSQDRPPDDHERSNREATLRVQRKQWTSEIDAREI